MISAITVTYGRVKWLEQTIADFLRQDCDCLWELLIVNTMPRQFLTGFFPHVRIINLPQRPDSLGHARNIAVAAAAYHRIVVADDDDAYLPHFLRTFDENWSPGLDWLWLDKRLCAYGEAIKEISYGCHGGCFGFTKHAWESVGAYPRMTVGEDRALVGKITKQFNGRKVMLGDTTPPFICRMANGAYHVSGLGDDKPGDIPAHDRIAADLSRRLAARQEKTGTIVLKPGNPIDWPSKVEVFMDALSKKKSVNDVCIVLLGRYGDIVNLLPVAQHIANECGPPHWMVSREFADIFDGVSYVIPHLVDLRNDQLEIALQLARNEYKHVLCGQIYGGATWIQKKLCPTYNMESWRMCGFRHKFKDYSWRPLFDRRDTAREQALVAKVSVPGKPMLVVNLTHSISSPFPQGADLLKTLRDTLSNEVNIVDVGGLKLHRIYDLLGLMEAAACIISIDTAMLHLAASVSVPVVALLNDLDWLASECRGTHFRTIQYKEVASSVKMLCDALRSTIDYDHMASAVPVACASPAYKLKDALPTRQIFHCVATYEEVTERERVRKQHAIKSWDCLYASGVIPCHLKAPWKRRSRHLDSRTFLPYLKDILSPALALAKAEDIILFTNNDIICHPALPDECRFYCSLWGAVAIRRCEFLVLPPSFDKLSPQDWARLAKNREFSQGGRDAFAFTKQWLETRWNDLPDFLIGSTDWDNCVTLMMREGVGRHSHVEDMRELMWPAEMPLGWTAHIKHPSDWESGNNLNRSYANGYNRYLFQHWCLVNGQEFYFDIGGHMMPTPK